MKLIAYKGCREQWCRSHSEGVIFLITSDFWKCVSILPCQKIKPIGVFHWCGVLCGFSLLTSMPFPCSNTAPSAFEGHPLSTLCPYSLALANSTPGPQADDPVQWDPLSPPGQALVQAAVLTQARPMRAELGTSPGPVRKEGLFPCCCWRLPLPRPGENLPELHPWDQAVPKIYLVAFLKSEPTNILLHLSLFGLGSS